MWTRWIGRLGLVFVLGIITLQVSAIELSHSLLAPIPEWFLGLVVSGIFLLWLGAIYAFPEIHEFMKSNYEYVLEQLPKPNDSSTLLGLVFAALAIIASSAAGHEGTRYDVAIFFLGSAATFLFLHLIISRYRRPWPSYLSFAFVLSIWYCLSLSLFSLIDTQLQPRRFYGLRFIFSVLVPGCFVVYSVRSLRDMYRGGKIALRSRYEAGRLPQMTKNPARGAVTLSSFRTIFHRRKSMVSWCECPNDPRHPDFICNSQKNCPLCASHS